jgi:hypothetical protein
MFKLIVVICVIGGCNNVVFPQSFDTFEKCAEAYVPAHFEDLKKVVGPCTITAKCVDERIIKTESRGA